MIQRQSPRRDQFSCVWWSWQEPLKDIIVVLDIVSKDSTLSTHQNIRYIYEYHIGTSAALRPPSPGIPVFLFQGTRTTAVTDCIAQKKTT